MENCPLVSVLVPAYNHEKYVQETIRTIINQTYKNIELIVINDGSKDNTWQKIQEMETECKERFVRVVFKTKENEGTTHTLNKLLSEAQGEYVYLIASDDLAKESAIEKEVKFLNTNADYAFVVGDDEFIDSESKVCYWDKEQNIVYSKEEASYLTFGEYLQKIRELDFLSPDFGTYKTLYIGNYIPNGFLIRKSIFDTIGYFVSEAPLEDYYMMLQISKYAKMKYLNEVLFSYRWHSTNTIKNREKMIAIDNQTREYEDELLEKVDEKKVFKDVLEIKYGECYKKRGIPYVFQILRYRSKKYKTKVFKLFNFKIFQIRKKL